MKKLLFVFFALMFINYSNGQIIKQRVDSLLSQFIKVARIPGLSVAVSMGNKIIYSNAFGVEDINTGRPATIKTKYRIGSISKLLTATLFVKLLDKNIISENSKANEYVHSLPPAYKDITLYQLAAHTSGIRHYTRSEILSKNTIEYKKLEDGLSRFTNDTLLFSPGEKYYYSSYGYMLLGAVMENATGQSFNSLLKKEILEPADMTATIPETAKAIAHEIAFYYPMKPDSLVAVSPDNNSYKWPAGGYLSTPADMVRFGSRLLDKKIVDARSLDILFTPKKTNNGKETGVGFGFRIGTDSRGRKIVHHGGESDGARAFFLMYPDEKICIALCANVYGAPLFEGEAETIAGYFLGDYEFKQNLFPDGAYNFTTTVNKKELKGKIEIKGNKGMIYNFNNSNLPIVNIVKDKDKTRIIALSANGIMNFWITKDDSGYKGFWGYDKPLTAITLE
jgi:CubicO group peptidase (beta-lactamase class C family)